MKIIFLLIVIINILLIPTLGSKETYPIDTSKDILTEGISDPVYITEEATQILP